jgi:hypothetical protein
MRFQANPDDIKALVMRLPHKLLLVKTIKIND